MSRLVATVSGAVVAALIAMSSPAHATTADQCARAAEEGQKLRDESRLRAARARFLACSDETCPLLVRQDCVKWMSELDASLPSVSVRARDSRGQDVSGARLEIDGAVVLEGLRGQSVQIDPGDHMFILVSRSGERLEQHVVVVRGERDRIVTFVFPRALAADGSRVATSGGVNGATGPTATRESGPSYALPIGLAAFSVVALGTFVVLDLHAYGKYQDLRDGCGQTRSCPQGDIDGVRSEFIGAAVALGVGALAGGLATYFFVTTKRGDGARASIVPTSSGAAATFGGRF